MDGIKDLSHVSRIHVQNEKDAATLLQRFFVPSLLRSIDDHWCSWSSSFSDGGLINHPIKLIPSSVCRTLLYEFYRKRFN